MLESAHTKEEYYPTAHNTLFPCRIFINKENHKELRAQANHPKILNLMQGGNH